MLRVGFENTTWVLERAKSVHALRCTAIVMGYWNLRFSKLFSVPAQTKEEYQAGLNCVLMWRPVGGLVLSLSCSLNLSIHNLTEKILQLSEGPCPLTKLLTTSEKPYGSTLLQSRNTTPDTAMARRHVCRRLRLQMVVHSPLASMSTYIPKRAGLEPGNCSLLLFVPEWGKTTSVGWMCCLKLNCRFEGQLWQTTNSLKWFLSSCYEFSWISWLRTSKLCTSASRCSLCS